MRLVIPLVPPSVNHYIKHTRSGRHYVTREAQAFKDAVAIFARGEAVTAKRVRVALLIFLGHNQRLDADNGCKVALDALQESGAIKSDARVKELFVSIGRDPANPRTEIEVEAL